MKYQSLKKLIEKLKLSQRVKGIFTTGTTATKLNPESDIDLVVILDKNTEDIKSVYTMVENHFSDIFFFDTKFLGQLKNKHEVFGNNFDGIFLDWFISGKIEYDPENILTAIKDKVDKSRPLQKIDNQEKREFWIKINYNFIANSRYNNAKDQLYHSALEVRLLYSLTEIINAYFSFRDIPWRGEKFAIQYFEKNDSNFLSIFQKYTTSSSLQEKMKYYEMLLELTFFGDYQKWEKDFIIPISKQDQLNVQQLKKFWESLAN